MHFSKKNYDKWLRNTWKRCSTSLRNSNQNQNNINRTIIVKNIDLTSADNDAEKQNPHTLLGIRRSGTATVKNNLAVSQKIKHGDAIWSNFTPRHIPKGGGMKAYVHAKTCK